MTEEIDLQERFPDLQPIRRAPGLFRLNGFGTGCERKIFPAIALSSG